MGDKVEAKAGGGKAGRPYVLVAFAVAAIVLVASTAVLFTSNQSSGPGGIPASAIR